MWLLWLLSLLAFARWATRAFSLWRGWRTLPHLDQVPADGATSLPRLSVVVPALNEEETVEAAMRSLLAIDYPDLEILAVDDRSTDRTGTILDALAARDARVRVFHVRELPRGWLGKNHAMHLASREARGAWILFTDADVHFEPSALRRAVRYAAGKDLDHLVVLPESVVVGFWEKIFLSFFWVMFAFRQQPWKVRDPGSSAHIGVGAFNMVKTEAYRRAGGHAAMPMEVLDDVKLGKLMKERGARQDCLPSGGLVRVRWVVGLGGAVRGLTKNVFAALDYSPLKVTAVSLMILAGVTWPAIGLFVGPPGPRLLCAATLACMVWSLRSAIQTPGLSPLYGLGFPVAAVIFVYIAFRSMAAAWLHGGVVWRGTHYALSDLRRGLV